MTCIFVVFGSIFPIDVLKGYFFFYSFFSRRNLGSNKVTPKKGQSLFVEHLPYAKQLKYKSIIIPGKDFYLSFSIFACGQHKELAEATTTFLGWWELKASSHKSSQMPKERLTTNRSAGSSVAVLVCLGQQTRPVLPPQRRTGRNGYTHTHTRTE